MMTDDQTHRIERSHRAAQLVADRRVALHQLVFLPRQLSLLQQHAIRDRDLADVVQERAAMQRVEIGLIQPQLTAECGRVVGEPLAMSLGARVARLDDAPEREEERFGRLEIVGEPLEPHQRSHARLQLLRVDRLVEEIIGAGVETGEARLPLLCAADQHHRREARVGAGLEFGADIEPGDPRHHHVEQHEIRTLVTDDVERVVRGAREADLRVSLDLMFAAPGQTPASWKHSLDAAIALEVDHISTYGLTIEPNTPYERWQAREPAAFFDYTREAVLYDIAIETLERAGYEHYEISNFARPGHRCAHNENYWENGEYLGFGVGAASYMGGVRSVHTRALNEYVDAALGGAEIPGESECLEGAQRLGEAIMLALRTTQGVALGDFKERYEIDIVKWYGAVIDQYVSDGLLVVDGQRMQLTRRGRFLANDICAAFVVAP